MKFYGVTLDQLEAARDKADSTGNLIFNRCDNEGNHYNITLRVRDSRGRFHRRGYSGRRLISACFHGHEHFMAALYSLEPNTRIVLSMATFKDVHDFKHLAPSIGDHNIGSMVSPLSFEDACDCTDEDLCYYEDYGI